MGPSVLGLGIPATSPMVPDARREQLQKVLDHMNDDMNASPYDWEMFYFTPDMEFDLLTEKLRKKNWDIVMVGSELLYPLQISFLNRWLMCLSGAPHYKSTHAVLREDCQHGARGVTKGQIRFQRRNR